MHDQILHCSSLLKSEFLTIETTVEKMPFSDDASSNIKPIVEQINQLQGLSRQVIKDFRDTLEKVDELM